MWSCVVLSMQVLCLPPTAHKAHEHASIEMSKVSVGVSVDGGFSRGFTLVFAD